MTSASYGEVCLLCFPHDSRKIKSILYLSLPVFSHWQGRLDPPVMFLGGRRSAMTGTGTVAKAAAADSLRNHVPGRLENITLQNLEVVTLLVGEGD